MSHVTDWIGDTLRGVSRASSRLNRGARATAVEGAWLAAHAVTYPLGLLRERTGADTTHPYTLDRLDPMQRGLLVGDVEAAGTPIVLVHGIADNRTVFGPLRRHLARRGFGRMLSFSYRPLPTDLREPAAHLAQAIGRLCDEAGYERVHLVGHSLGGLVARYCVQALRQHDRVHTLATLGTPHGGTRLAHVLPHPLLRQLRPGSDVLTELAEPAPECTTRFLALWSDCDEIIQPNENARLDHPDLDTHNIAIRGVGHMSFPISGAVVEELATSLAQPDVDRSWPTPAKGDDGASATPPSPHRSRRHSERRKATDSDIFNGS